MANTTGKKYGGRQKGATNKITKEVRQVLSDVSKEYFNTQFHADMA